jgi:SAM-dependent methyltransferase
VTESHAYDDHFFDWVDSGARMSARALLPRVKEALDVQSVVDVGCGRGTWLSVWTELGVRDVVGLDGDYVDRSKLAIPAHAFKVTDLSHDWSVERRFDLAQSLEVAEHLPQNAARSIVNQLCSLADVVLFSAARPGQGGEMHVNEQEPEYWAELFAMNGFAMFDWLRPALARNRQIEPWYRYNSFLYASEAGQKRLSDAALTTHVPEGTRTSPVGDPIWRLRLYVLRHLSVEQVARLSRARYRVATLARRLRRRSI